MCQSAYEGKNTDLLRNSTSTFLQDTRNIRLLLHPSLAADCNPKPKASEREIHEVSERQQGQAGRTYT